MTLAARTRRNAPKGRERPRIAPPVPARSDLAAFRQTATGLGITLMPWQISAARYLEALASGSRHLYREVAIVVARQNGKTELLVPLIVKRLREGRRIMHTAQDRSLPREVFYRVADIMWEHDRKLFPMRNDRQTKPRYANGQEEIRLRNGGVYSIVAPTRGGARGPTRDLVIIDELREMDSWDFIAAAKPTLTLSPDPQMLYLSNAGEDISIVLNAIRKRRDEDPALAYLEWSAAPDRPADDPIAWAEANPALGHEPESMGSITETLTDDYRTAKLEGTLGIFETEHLCRWVATTRELLVAVDAWTLCAGEAETPRLPMMAVSMDPDRKRASAAIAWAGEDATHLQLLFDVTGDPIDTDALGQDLRTTASKLGVRRVGYDPITDRELVKYFKKAESISGGMFANATSQFANVVSAKTLRWHEADPITDDLTWTARKLVDRDTGAFEAVRAQDDRPITAALAAIRAVYLATGLKLAAPRVM
jgi:phage terminase large subunit-like protein